MYLKLRREHKEAYRKVGESKVLDYRIVKFMYSLELPSYDYVLSQRLRL